MSTSIMENQELPVSAGTQAHENRHIPVPEPLGEEFGYKPVPVLAPVGLFLGLFSIMGLVTPAALAISVLGSILAGAGLTQIIRARGEMGGRMLALTGLVLSVGFLFSGTALHAYNYATEVPEGFERLDFRWLSQQQPIVEGGFVQVAPEAAALDGKKVFLKGYMYPTRRTTGITSFVLCKDTGECCFGGQPKMTDMVVVEFQNGMTVSHREQQLVSVAGVLRPRPIMQGGQLVALYTLEGSYFR